MPVQNGTFESFMLPFAGALKKITVFIPPGFQKECCGLIYMTDSQNLFGADAPYGGWKADEAVLSEQKAIPYMIVAVDNADGKREEELTPDIGPVPPAIQAIDGHDFSVRRGIAFARFLKEELDPHIRGKYHICPGRANTIIAGSSSGGLEAFYVGMRYPGTYGCIAALSPAFFLFEEDTWKRFFEKLQPAQKKHIPYLYLSNGAGDWLETILLGGTRRMEQRLISLGYPREKLLYEEIPEEKHNEEAWRRRFPQALRWFVQYNEEET